MKCGFVLVSPDLASIKLKINRLILEAPLLNLNNILFQTKPMTVISAILIWLLAATFALPDAIYADTAEAPIPNSSITICTPFPNATTNENYAKYNVAAKALVYYILPLTIISAFYVLMAKRLHDSANEMPGELQGAQSVAQARARRHVARMVLIFVFCK